MTDDDAKPQDELHASSLRVVRLGHGANCSSVGSVIDTLFLSATVGGALLAAICAAMKTEGVTVVGAGRTRESDPDEPPSASAEEGT